MIFCRDLRCFSGTSPMEPWRACCRRPVSPEKMPLQVQGLPSFFEINETPSKPETIARRLSPRGAQPRPLHGTTRLWTPTTTTTPPSGFNAGFARCFFAGFENFD